MIGRLVEVSRSAFVWSGLVVIGAIAFLALANLGLRSARVLLNAAEPEVELGLLGLIAYVGVGLAALLGALRLATRGPLGLRLALLGGLLLLAVVRIVIGIQVDSQPDGEMRQFDALARGMLAGECCFSDRATGYPLVLAGAYALLGPSAAAGEGLNLVLGLLGGGVLFYLLLAHAGGRAAVIGLYLLALWPAGALISNTRLSETLYITLLLLGALSALHARGAASAALAGAILAAAHYVRPTTLALVPALLLAHWWPGVSVRGAILRTALPMGAAVLLLLTPLLSYNLQAHGEISLSSSAFGGWSLYMGTDQRSGGRYSAQAAAEIEALTPGGTWEDSAAAGRLAVQRIVRDPLGFAAIVPVKFNTLWGSEDFGVIYGLARGALYDPRMTFPMMASMAFYAGVTSLAALALFRRRRDFDRLIVLCVALILAVALIHVFVEVRDRYHAYLTPLFIALVALEAPRWLAGLSRRRADTRLPGGAAG